MTLLTLEYRPRRFSQVVGQKHVTAVLKKMVETKDLPAALLLSGTRGTGKTTTARILAAALNCPDQEGGEPCGKATCSACESVRKTNSVDVIEVDAASNGLVEDIRKLKEACLYSSVGEYRVILLDEAQSMSNSAFNALLKILEEPPPNTLFVLLTTEPHKILATVVSRCMSFDFKRISKKDIVELLRSISDTEWPNNSGGDETYIQDEVIDAIADRVQGGMRDAIMLLDQTHRLELRTLAQFNEAFGIRDVSVDLLRAAAIGDSAKGFRLIEEHFYRSGEAAQLVNDMTARVRDGIILAEGAGDVLSETRLKDLEGLATLLPKEKLVIIMRVLWELKTKVRHVDDDQRSAMEMAFVLISAALTGTSGTPKNGQTAQPLSLGQMQAIAGRQNAEPATT